MWPYTKTLSLPTTLVNELIILDDDTKREYGIRPNMATLPMRTLRRLAGDKRRWTYLCKEIALETRIRWVIAERQRQATEGHRTRQAQEDNLPMDAETLHAVATEVRAMQDNERTPKVLRNRTY